MRVSWRSVRTSTATQWSRLVGAMKEAFAPIAEFWRKYPEWRRDTRRNLLWFFGVWLVPVLTVFWMEPLLVHQLVGHGRFGLGPVTWYWYVQGVLQWLVPLVIYAGFALLGDAEAYHEYRKRRPLAVVGQTVQPDAFRRQFYSPLRPALRDGPGDFVDFTRRVYSREGLQTTAFMAVFLVAGSWLVGWFLDSMPGTGSAPPLIHHFNLVHFGVALTAFIYLLVSALMFFNVAHAASKSRSSCLFLPWRQRWTWALFLVMLPWQAFEFVALARLLFTSQPGTKVRDVLAEVLLWPARSQLPADEPAAIPK